MIGTHTTLKAILNAKEKRVLEQQMLLKRFPEASLISLCINIPGTLKLSHEAVVLHEVALESIMALLEHHAIVMHEKKTCIAVTGAETLFTCKSDAMHLKQLMCELENEHPLGRLMDIDVLDSMGKSLSRTALGFEKRRCFVCACEASLCARSQKHSYEELHAHIKTLVGRHAWETSMALWCARAMQTEVELTPKPGLVDQANSGAHRDMDIQTFYQSIQAIQPFTKQFLHAARMSAKEHAKETFARVRFIGIACEKAMFEATNGVNTHKGMIFSLALVCAALGRLKANETAFTCKNIQHQIQAMCENLVEEDLAHAKPNSAGERFFHETGSSGIRGVAQSGFAIIFEESLPFFQSQKALFSEEIALKQTLLYLMAHVEDSTLWSRGGLDGLRYTKKEAQKLLHVKDETDALDARLQTFDVEMINKNLSPGGSADLLALTWLLSKIID